MAKITDREPNAENIGAELGTEGVGGVVSKVEAYCAHEEQRIALANQPRIVALRAEGSFLLDEERELVERLRHAPPPGDLRTGRRKAIYYACVTASLTVAAFVFSLFSLEPFRLGFKAYLYCLGIAVVTPFLVERALEKWKTEALLKRLTTVGCIAALVSLILLAVIRGNIMAEEMKNSNPVITIDDAPQEAEPQQNTFYERLMSILQLVMALLAFAMELGAGLALYEAWRLSSDAKEDWAKLRRRHAEVRERLGLLAAEIVELEHAPQAFVQRFWRNFYRSMITQSVRSAMTKLGVGILAFLFLIHGQMNAQTKTEIVVAIDLTQSENARDPDGKTEFQKNVEGVTKLLAQVPANSHISIIGITDRSFAQPDILLSATIATDPGYFGERLSAARQSLAGIWRTRSEKLQPIYKQTDIIGALVLAEQMFDQQSEACRKALVLYSDMRSSTPELNLESPINMAKLDATRQALPYPDFRRVKVFVLGVDGAGQSISEFCTRFLGAIFRSFRRYGHSILCVARRF